MQLGSEFFAKRLTVLCWKSLLQYTSWKAFSTEASYSLGVGTTLGEDTNTPYSLHTWLSWNHKPAF